jgi:cyclohexyl-isocyanide hydratase
MSPTDPPPTDPPLKPGDPFRILMPVFPDITQLDLAGPQEVLKRVRGVSVQLAWKSREPVRSASGLLLMPDGTFDELREADLLCVPGGPGHVALMADAVFLDWLRAVASRARWVTSVCTGSLLLGAAGLLRGYRATTHWGSMDALPLLGAQPVAERVVFDRDRVTGGGVTSGIDFALALIGRLWGADQAGLAQLSLEYDPQPPFDAGSPRSAPPALVERVRAAMTPYRERVLEAARRAGEAMPPAAPPAS